MTIVIAILTSGAFTALVTFFCNFYLDSRKKQSGVEHGTQLLLCKMLKEECREYIRRGWISFDEHEELLTAFSVYKDELHGNGYLDAMMELVNRLEKRKS